MTQNHKVVEIRKAQKSLLQFLDVRARRQDGVELFGQAVEALRPAVPSKETDIALGLCLKAQGQFYTRLGMVEKGKLLAEEGLALLRRHDCPEDMVLALEGVAFACYFLNQWAIVERTSQEGYQIASECADQRGIAWHLCFLGFATLQQGNYLEAKRFGEESLKTAQAAGALSFLWEIAVLLGHTAIRLGYYEKAKQHLQQGLEHASELGQSLAAGICHRLLAKVNLLRGEYEEAQQHLYTSIKLFREIDLTYEIIRALAQIAELLVTQGRVEQAIEMLAFYLADPSVSTTIEREDAEHLLAEVYSQVLPDVFEGRGQRATQ